MFSIAFRLDSILNKQKIIKKIAFLGKMVKMVQAKSQNFQRVWGEVRKKKYTEILRKDQI
jgi:hypothetical protein